MAICRSTKTKAASELSADQWPAVGTVIDSTQGHQAHNLWSRATSRKCTKLSRTGLTYENFYYILHVMSIPGSALLGPWYAKSICVLIGVMPFFSSRLLKCTTTATGSHARYLQRRSSISISAGNTISDTDDSIRLSNSKSRNMIFMMG